MSKYILAVDPGTVNTGWAKVEVQEENINRIVGVGVTTPPKDIPPKRVSEIIRQLIEVLNARPMATEIWTEFFVPYAARKGAMWNTTLVGALLYLPITRHRMDLTSFGMFPATWKAWMKKEAGAHCSDPICALLEKYGVEPTDEQWQTMGESPHIRDAIGIAFYAVYGATDVNEISHSTD